ncbi:macrophage mannose receptor 1-like [Acipenser oxyrinchus oxyrinchus]|uniref:Macrophage mannose receptor 1-like n=1 Tax=Acipenser oxyrinchus oxyrinchus TaxID=40147 RepID=A0AAD8CP56_ACIOX|nr:macrophage mannose receptor 1-like [Acipenser oxyrinchus oxyrinchus]
MNEKSEWYDTSCSEKFLFVCCSGGSSGNCSFEGTEKTWHEAQRYCRNHNKDLVSIQDEARMNDILKIILSKSTWIGLHRDKENWQWSNGGDVIYSNWRPQLFCASFNSKGGVWNESLCKETKPFMCYNETSNIAERYTLIEELKTWTEAQQYCREHHTDLVSIKSASENEDLVKKAQGKPFWIGLFNEPWKWSHQGDNYTFHNWASTQSNNFGGAQKCVEIGVRHGAINSQGEWEDLVCNEKKAFMCYTDHMAIGRVKFTAPRGMNPEDPKVSEAILEQIREHLSKSTPMGGVKLRWRKQNGEIFHKDEEEGCPKP